MRSVYIVDRNAFSLVKPPDWWLTALREFDPDLVLIPSRMRPLFWLARRQRLSAGFSFRKLAGIEPTPDAAMMAEHRLVSVVTLISTTWDTGGLQELLRWLREHDTWREEGGPLDDAALAKALSNGGSKVTRRVDYDDKLHRRRQATQQRERIYHATGDAYRSLQARLGRTIRNPGLPKQPSNAGV